MQADTDSQFFLKTLESALESAIVQTAELLNISRDISTLDSEQLGNITSALSGAQKILIAQKSHADGNERTFIHDIASPVATVLFISDALREDVMDNSAVKAKTSDLFKTIDGIRVLLHERREILVKRGVPSAKHG